MSQTISLKVRRMGTSFAVFFFVQEASRSYGGQIISVQSNLEAALRFQNDEAWRRGLTIIPYQA